MSLFQQPARLSRESPLYNYSSMITMRRRDFLKSTVFLAATPSPDLLADAAALPVGKSQAFDFAWLKGHARALAGAAYQPPEHTLPKPLANLDYDQYQAIRFRADHALWAGEALDFRVQFFHLGRSFKEPVRMYEVVNGQAQEIAYDPAMFDLRQERHQCRSAAERPWLRRLSRALPHRLERDVAAFLGASYFRAVGEDFRQYGISARGLAIDTALDHGRRVSRSSPRSGWSVRRRTPTA